MGAVHSPEMLPAPTGASDADVGIFQEFLANADLQTTARYLHSDTRTKQAAVGKLAAAFVGAHAKSAQPAL
jgi:hypothetical protein